MYRSFIKSIVALMMLGVFLAPNVMPSLHALLEEHDHFVCHAADESHLHQKHDECDLCHYWVNLKTSVESGEAGRVVIISDDTTLLPPRDIYTSTDSDGIRLRGPPALA